MVCHFEDDLKLHTTLTLTQPSNLPNLRRLFVEARTEAEESAYSRNAVSLQSISYKAAGTDILHTVLQPGTLYVLRGSLQPRGAENEWTAVKDAVIDFPGSPCE